MTRFLIRRILSGAATIALVIIVTFFLMHLVPGGPFHVDKMTVDARASLEAKYSLDQPVAEQFLRYVEGLIRFDFGPSLILRGRSVRGIILEKLPLSTLIGLMALGLSLLLGIPAGVAAAVHHRKPVAQILSVLTTIGMSVPGFLMAILLLLVFAVKLRVVPVIWSGRPANFILPVLAYSIYPVCMIARLTKMTLLDVRRQDFILMARAKGLSISRMAFSYYLRNAAVPILACIGPMTAFLITGGIAIEKIFGIPGIGSIFAESVGNRDYPLIMGAAILLTILMVLLNILTDLISALIDPRLRVRS